MASRCTKTGALAALCLAALALALPQPAAAQSADGQWDALIVNEDMFMAAYALLMKNGKVLWLGDVPTQVAVYDPSDGSIDFDILKQPAPMSCAAYTQLSDGLLFMAGGGGENQGEQNEGHEFVYTFDPDKYDLGQDPWVKLADMVNPGNTRWYPSATTLGTGHVLVLAGRGTRGNDDPDDEDFPESYNPATDTWTSASNPSAEKVVHYYPFSFQLSDATVFMAGSYFFHHSREPKSIHQLTYTFNPALQTWSDPGIGLSPNNGFLPPCGSAVMYAPDKVIKCGASRNAVVGTSFQAYAIDMNTLGPQWSAIDSMEKGRKMHQLLVLPDARALVMGGYTGCVWPGVPVLEPEWIVTSDLTTEQWDLLAPMDANNPRTLHATTVLLADGSVLTAGGEKGEQNEELTTAQIFRPPYLFTDVASGSKSIDDPSVNARPVIDSAPAEIYYGLGFQIDTPVAASVSKVALIRLAATTHGFDQNTRYVPLSFVTGAFPETLTVAAPPQSNLAPPGYYMLFILIPGDRPDIEYPSLAKMVRLTSSTP